MNTQTPVTLSLDRQGIPYRLFRHPGPIHSLEQAALERGQQPGQVIRSLLFRISEGDYVMVLIAGPQQVSWPKLRKYLNHSRLTTATEAEVLAVTGYVTGAVSPFGLSTPIRLLVDPSVFLPLEVSIGSGERGLTVILTTANLRLALPSHEIASFTT